MSEIMASAIAPADSTPTPTNGLKRRQSDELEAEVDSKRQRTIPGKNSPTATPEVDAPKKENQPEPEPSARENGPAKQSPAQKAEDGREPRRKSAVVEEKQRSKRLFGALLGNLNQPRDRVSSRRSEIEQRRKAELQKQDDERLEDRQRRLEKLAIQRKKEQINIDERDMHLRHKQLLNSANYLQTCTEPKLYYRPWELLPDEEDRVEDQLKDARSQIDKELAEWEDEKQRRFDDLDGSAASKTLDTGRSNDEADQPTTSSKTEVSEEANADGNADRQIPPRTNHPDNAKPAEIPDSDPGPTGADKNVEDDMMKQQVEGAEAVEEDAQEKKGEAKQPEVPQEEPKDEADDESEHMVEGDEDTVIY